MGRTKARYRCANEYVILDQRTGSGTPPLAHSLLHTQSDKRGGADVMYQELSVSISLHEHASG